MQPHDTWYFTGAKATYTTLNADNDTDGGWGNNALLTILPSTAHGFFASSGSLQSLIYIQGTTYYNGLRKIHAVADNTITIYAKYVAAEATFGGTLETVKTMYSDNHPFEFLGFELTIDAAVAATEDLTIIIDAAAGSTFDNLIYKKAMNGVRYINYMFDVPRKCAADDKVDVAWANATGDDWGIKLFTRRLV